MTIAGFVVSVALFAIGWVLFGLASLRGDVHPRKAVALLIVGVVVAVLPLFALDVTIGFGVFGAALAWMGYKVWSHTGERAFIIPHRDSYS